MLTPSLQLERSFFTDVHIQADPKHVLGKGEVEVTTSQTLGRASQDGSRWVVELDIAIAGKQGSIAPPYHIHLHSVGTFLFGKADVDEAQKARLLAITGVSILYSQAREYLLILTARGPWGSFQLPTVSFVDARPTQQPQAPEVTEMSTKGHRAPKRIPAKRVRSGGPSRTPPRRARTGE